MSDNKYLHSVIIVHIVVFGIFYSDFKKLVARQETADTFSFNFFLYIIYTNIDFMTFDKRSADSKNNDDQKDPN